MKCLRTVCVALLALPVFAGCDQMTPSVPEAEPDAAPTAAPGCPYAPDPLDACEPPRLTEPACIVEIEGAERLRAVHYDADGAAVAKYGPDGLAWTGRRDPARGWRLSQAIGEGCVTHEREVTRLTDGFRVRDRHAEGEQCIATDDATSSETMWEGLRAIDPGCDCRDVDVRRDCVPGPHGPLRCEHFRGGGLTRVETWLYNEAGQVARHTIDLRGRAAVFDRSLTYDAEGRQIEELFLCPSCTGATVTRDTWTYEAVPPRMTYRHDADDDGMIETVERTTYDDAGREILFEKGDDEGLTRRRQATYGDDGGHRILRFEDDEVTTIDEVVVEGRRTTHIWTRDGQQIVSIVETDEADRVVETVSIDEPSSRFHVRYRRDVRGRLVERRVSWVRDGTERTCATRLAWRGACPTLPAEPGVGCDPQ